MRIIQVITVFVFISCDLRFTQWDRTTLMLRPGSLQLWTGRWRETAKARRSATLSCSQPWRNWWPARFAWHLRWERTRWWCGLLCPSFILTETCPLVLRSKLSVASTFSEPTDTRMCATSTGSVSWKTQWSTMTTAPKSWGTVSSLLSSLESFLSTSLQYDRFHVCLHYATGTSWCVSWLLSFRFLGLSRLRQRTSPSFPPLQGPCESLCWNVKGFYWRCHQHISI